MQCASHGPVAIGVPGRARPAWQGGNETRCEAGSNVEQTGHRVERPDTERPPTIHVVVECEARRLQKVQYTVDTLLMACGLCPVYVEQAPATGPWIRYASTAAGTADARCLHLLHDPQAWAFFDGDSDVTSAQTIDGTSFVLAPQRSPAATSDALRFDLAANAFYFLSSWSERRGPHATHGRGLFADSVFARLNIAQGIVDEYVELLRRMLQRLDGRVAGRAPLIPRWPAGRRFALVLSHDVDFIPGGAADILAQGAKSVLRHLVRQRDPVDAARAAAGLARALVQGRDPYGCIGRLLAEERRRKLKASFQVAVARRHPNDVNYDIEDERTCAYLRSILVAGAELCLHGSCRSTERDEWYAEEVERLTRRLARPVGSRQHYLSFDYDALFAAQERNGIEYDMSLGYPDRIGARAGFSCPYFPYDLSADRPYRVLQISLFLMDVTLRSYMGLKGEAAWDAIEASLQALRKRGGGASAVWHPIVFGGARDPGYDRLYWRLTERVGELDGMATDGRTVNAAWRGLAKHYPGLRAAAS